MLRSIKGILWSVEALIPTCQAQDAILSRSRDTYVIGAQPHFGRLARWISLHRTITYIHGGYNNTYKSHEYNNINTRHPTTDANMKSTTTSICYPRLPTRNLTQDWRRRTPNNEQRSHVKTSETCTCNCCCSICEPRGLSNPITMGNKTSKA